MFIDNIIRGSLFQNLAFVALALVSATFQVAIFNLVPAVTFILSILCGYVVTTHHSSPSPSSCDLYFISFFIDKSFFAELIAATTYFCSYEKLNMRTAATNAKVLGTILGITGSMLLSFLKGVEINIWKDIHINLFHKNINSQLGTSHGREWLGVLCGIGSCLSFSIWLIIQVSFLYIVFIATHYTCFLIYLKGVQILISML